MLLQLLRAFSQICQNFNQNGHVNQIEQLEKPWILIVHFASLQSLGCYFVNFSKLVLPIAKSTLPNCKINNAQLPSPCC